MALLAGELVVAELALTRDQAKVLRLERGVPGPLLGADRAVAASGARFQVDVGFEAHAAAMAAAVVGLLHADPPVIACRSPRPSSHELEATYAPFDSLNSTPADSVAWPFPFSCPAIQSCSAG